MTDPRRFIADQLHRLHVGDAWHGPSMHEALDGVTAAMAVSRPVPNAHNIAEYVHHIAAWAGEVTMRLGGREPQMPEAGDFPEPLWHLTDDEWAALRDKLDRAHEGLAAAILAFDVSRLDEPVGTARDAPTGTGVTYAAMLHGLVQHDAYHAGQLVMLRRALG
ncbi:MAG: DinB family protein [Gemmatimonadaceae bacterium]|nr:DinB family protein [Gemmatimonadaceae bacterium]